MENKKIKILYIITLPIIGGAQVHLYDVIRNLPKKIMPYVIVGQDGWLVEKLRNEGCNVFIVKSLVRQISPMKDIEALFDCYRLIKELRPDLIHCHSSKAGIIGRVAAKICKVPAIFTAHGWAFTEGVSEKKRLFYKKIETFMAKYTEKIICVSDYDCNLARDVMPEYRDRLITIHNGISNMKNFQAVNEKKDSLHLVMVARFCPPKQQRQIIDVVHDLVYEGKLNICLTLIGDGPEYEEVYAYTQGLQTPNCIEFLGAKTDAAKLLFKYDVFVLLSNWEGLPLSILEAMRQGLPVLASDVGGIPETVENEKTGYLIPRGDKNSLSVRICQLYKDRSLCVRLGEAGRDKYVNEFTSDIMMERLLSVYMMAQKNSRIVSNR